MQRFVDAFHRRAGGKRRPSDAGAAVVDFVMVGGLLTIIFVSVIQLTLVLHVRNTLIDAAASGARYGTLADRTPADAVYRTESLIRQTLNDSYAGQVEVRQGNAYGVATLEVVVRAPLPVIGLLGPTDVLEVRGHAALQR